MPKIGSVLRRDHGSFDVGPIPDLGGPFDTAAEYFEAWAATAKFPTSEQHIRENMHRSRGPLEEVLASVRDFPKLINALASSLSSRNNGPFPLYHPDLYHSNIMVDEKFNVLSFIDWQGACTVPWEVVEFPLFLTAIPRAMDASWNYDELGQPKDEDTRLIWRERAEYVEMVRSAEATLQPDAWLSTTLADAQSQSLATSMRVYKTGKLGLYNQILIPFQRKSREGEKDRGSCRIEYGDSQIGETILTMTGGA